MITGQAKRKIYILLTRFPGVGQNVMRFFTASYYTHVSVGLEEDLNTFYSFVLKGFIVEEITRYLKRSPKPYPCCLYEIEVTGEVYDQMKACLFTFVQNQENLHYSRLGVALSILQIPFKRKGYYFCSQFVAELLRNCRAVSLKKHSSLYLPRDFKRLYGIKMSFRGNLEGMRKRYGLKPVFV